MHFTDVDGGPIIQADSVGKAQKIAKDRMGPIARQAYAEGKKSVCIKDEEGRRHFMGHLQTGALGVTVPGKR